MHDTKQRFSEHIYDPIRIEIGLNLISRELSKIYPNNSYEQVKKLVNGHFPVLNTDENIRHFWNQVNNCTLGLWQKNTIKYVTSKNYSWQKIDDLDIYNVRLNWDFNGRLSFKGQTVFELKKYLDDNPEIKKEQMDFCARRYHGESGRFDRVVLTESKSRMSVVDGHGRLIYMLLNDKFSINAYLGKEQKLSRHDDWIPTEYLLRLVMDRSYGQLARILKVSPNALTEFKFFLPIDNKLKNKILGNIKLLNNTYNVERILNKVILRF